MLSSYQNRRQNRQDDNDSFGGTLIAHIIEILSALIVATISALGYPGVVLLMGIESACIPLPSEIIMPFSGYLVYTGRFSLWAVSTAGALGCVVGSLVAYWVGLYGGRPFIEKYGRYVLISIHDLDIADRWFARRGELIVFASRLLPAIRTFIPRLPLSPLAEELRAALGAWPRTQTSSDWLSGMRRSRPGSVRPVPRPGRHQPAFDRSDR